MVDAPELAGLRAEIIACRRCDRLVRFREKVAVERKREFSREEYWGRPVPGFGDPAARLAIVGLAPSAHGANRTGRIFTGDRSGDFLVKALHRAGFANQSTSTKRGDGLRYQDAFVTAAVRCAPPDNRPKPPERAACAPFLLRELQHLGRLQAILALGGFAWDSVLDSAATLYGTSRPRAPFAHGGFVALGPGRPNLYASYHPSPQNTQTRRLTGEMMDELFHRIRAGFGAVATSPGRKD